MADTPVAWVGYFSRAYAVIALDIYVSIVFYWVSLLERGHGNLHCGTDHAGVYEHPAKSETYPVFAKLESQTVGEQTTSHGADGPPDAMETILRAPLEAPLLEDPFVEEVAEYVTCPKKVVRVVIGRYW